MPSYPIAGIDGSLENRMRFLLETVALMRSVKQALDPKNIMNPGKIVSL